MTVYSRIQDLCKQKGITVLQLEKETGKYRSFYQKWATSTPNMANLIEVADYFNVSLDSLVGRNVETPDASFTDEYVDVIDLYSKLDNIDKETIMRMLKSLANK